VARATECLTLQNRLSFPFVFHTFDFSHCLPRHIESLSSYRTSDNR
jgi:hypothetical protein